MQTQFICYKPKLVNLELRHKLTIILLKLLVKNIKIKSSQSTQSNLRLNTLSSIRLKEIVSSIGLEFLQAEHVGLT